MQLLDRHCRSWAETLSGLRGKSRAAAGFLFGGLLTLALPPASLAPLVLIAIPALIWLLRGCADWRAAAALGWWVGFGYFALGIYWVGVSLFTDIARWWWAVPFAFLALPAALSLFFAAAFAVARSAIARGAAEAPAFALAWSAAEWLRGTILTGFPWNPIGQLWLDWTPLAQMAAVLGVFGSGLLTVWLAGLPAALATSPRAGRAGLAVALGGFALLALAGQIRIATAPMLPDPDVTLRIVQPDNPPAAATAAADRQAGLDRLFALSRDSDADIIIWPEAAVPGALARSPSLLAEIAAMLAPGQHLLTGAFRVTEDADGNSRIANALEVVDSDGTLVASYEKAHLVPFGEYMPLRSVLPLEAVAAGTLDLSPGPGPRSLEVGDLPAFSPLICYEAIFPGKAVAGGTRPLWLLGITNDAWFGRTAGPHQHLAAARMRAIEQGIPMIRAANGGVSAIIDAFGRIRTHLPLAQRGILDAEVPPAIASRTNYARIGEFSAVCLFFLGLVASFRFKPKPRSERDQILNV